MSMFQAIGAKLGIVPNLSYNASVKDAKGRDDSRPAASGDSVQVSGAAEGGSKTYNLESLTRLPAHKRSDEKAIRALLDDPGRSQTDKALANMWLALKPQACPCEKGYSRDISGSVTESYSNSARAQVEKFIGSSQGWPIEQVLASATNAAVKTDAFHPMWIQEIGLKTICRFGSGSDVEIARLGMKMGDRGIRPDDLRCQAYKMALTEISKPTSKNQGERLATVARYSMPYPSPSQEAFEDHHDYQAFGKYGLQAIIDSPAATPQQKAQARQALSLSWENQYFALNDLHNYGKQPGSGTPDDAVAKPAADSTPKALAEQALEEYNLFGKHDFHYGRAAEGMDTRFRAIRDNPQSTIAEKALAEMALNVAGVPGQSYEDSAKTRAVVAEAIIAGTGGTSVGQAIANVARKAGLGWQGLEAVRDHGTASESEIATLGLKLGRTHLYDTERSIALESAMDELLDPSSKEQGERLASVAHNAFPWYPDSKRGYKIGLTFAKEGLSSIANSSVTSPEHKARAREAMEGFLLDRQTKWNKENYVLQDLASRIDARLGYT